MVLDGAKLLAKKRERESIFRKNNVTLPKAVSELFPQVRLHSFIAWWGRVVSDFTSYEIDHLMMNATLVLGMVILVWNLGNLLLLF